MSKEKNFGYLGNTFQLQILNNIILHKDFASSIVDVLEPKYFDNQYFKLIMQMTKEYYHKYEHAPSFSTLEQITKSEVTSPMAQKMVLDMITQVVDAPDDGYQYVQEKALKFCKQQELQKVMTKAQKIIDKGDFESYDHLEEMVREALQVGEVDTGTADVFFNLDEVLDDDFRHPIPIGITGIDNLLKGGLAKGEIGVILAPTGVGKTELTKAVAEYLFDDDSAMVRIDMSEFMEKHAVSRLIGAPPGYVGYDEGGVLTEAVRRRPYQVVLFDEVEKAHPDVFNVLLQVLDDGILTDGQGRTVDFKQTLIILTSNLGAQALSQLPDGADPTQAKRDVMEAVRAHFRPEFLNRLDETIIFDRLAREDMAGIVTIQMKRLEERLAGRNIHLDLDEAALKWLADEGYDPVFGARPLKRVIQRALQNQLAEMILAGDVLDGDTITVSAGVDGLLVGDRVSSSNRQPPEDAVVH